MPVLKHFDGNCHLYVDATATTMEKQVRDICVNAKTATPGGAVCNAVEHLLFHKDAATALLRQGLRRPGRQECRSAWRRTHAPTLEIRQTHDAEDWDTEYLAFVVGVKVVDSIDDAIAHINDHGSHHTGWHHLTPT
jgi:glutamate-5-semialdehyde dehydrogenase